MITIVQADKLKNTCPEDMLKGLATDRLKPDHEIIGQERAARALQLGLGIKAQGFNIFVAGIHGTGKLTAVKSYLEEPAKQEPVPADWCYINNFKDPFQPRCLQLPAGRATAFKKEMKSLVQESLLALFKNFESEEYVKRRLQITDKLEKQQNIITNTIREKAEKESLLIKQTPWEIFTLPLRNGEPMTDQEFSALPVSEQESIRAKQNQFADEIKAALQATHKLERDATKDLANLEKEVAEYTINTMMAELEERYCNVTAVIEFLHAVKNDILENLPEFLLSHKAGIVQPDLKGNDFLKRYDVNIIVDNSTQTGAPVVFENNPTYNNLVGRVEKESIMGTLVTDFTMIRSGAFHKANGGYLIIRADELFKNYFSWEAMKRAVRNKEIMIEEAADQLGYLTTKTLKPEPIPLQVKIILVGNPMYYYLLYAYDPDFRALFKVKADFDSEMDRSNENLINYIKFVQNLAAKENLFTADIGALAKMIEFGSRLAGDQEKLSTRFDDIADILREANHYAKQDGANSIQAAHIKKAIEEKIYRSNLIQEKFNELIQKKQIFIDFEGSKTGQVNGLSVIDLGDISFGKPSRITCTVNLGRGGIIAIEREAELSGPIHTKGILILTGYLAEKYFQDIPVSLSARLVFEQSYSEVEGDSASSTELYAILSNLSRLPIKQGIAVTGSVNQKGEIQAIGGVNEKIEGYFEICKIVGMNGEQGVLIPAANIRNLMLKDEVIEAVRTGKFHIWAVETIDDGIEILTGIKAGSVSEEGTVFSKVNDMIYAYSDKLKKFGEETAESGKPDSQVQWVTDIV